MRHILADSEAKVVLTSDLMDAHANLSDQLRAATSRGPDRAARGQGRARA